MHDIPDLLDGLKRTPTILTELVSSIPADRLDARRGADFWTIGEHVIHLAHVQPMLLDRMHRFATEVHPEFHPYHPDQDEDELPERSDPQAALEQFAALRQKQLSLLGGLGKSVWERRGSHPEYDQYSLYILTRHTLMHDHWHMYRIEELWLTRDAFLTRLE